MRKERGFMQLSMAALLALASGGSAQEAKPAQMKDVFQFVGQALKEDSKLKVWRPALRKAIEAYLKKLGKDAAPESARDAARAMESAFVKAKEVIRANTEKTEGILLVVKDAKGLKLNSTLLICESADFVEIDHSVVVCLGDLKVREELHQSVIFARGKVEVGGNQARDEAFNSTIFCEGEFRCVGYGRDSTLLALGGVRIEGRSKENVFVNCPSVKLGDSFKDKQITKKDLPGAPQ